MASRVYSELVDPIDALERCRTAPALMDAAAGLFADFGIEHFAFAGVARNAAAVPETILAWRYPEEMYRIYTERQLFDFDPAMRFLRKTILPFRWRDAPHYPDLEPVASELSGLVHDFGIANGVFFPVLAADGERGNVWVAGDGHDAEGPRKWEVQLFACHAFEYLQRLVAPPAAIRSPLTAREKEIVTWTALGKTGWEISEILKISVRTVNEYAQTARRKLGATNRAHMVAISMRDRLIDL